MTELSADVRRQELMSLMKKKDEMEKSIIDITEYLEAPGMPGVKGSLVDEEGFPRNDIDLFDIRKNRNRLACLQTDHVNLMKDIEKGLFALHEGYIKEECKDDGAPREERKLDTMSQSSSTKDALSDQQTQKIPFAWISDVISGSPADQAGLKLGDAVYRFGDIDTHNHDNLKAIVELVKKRMNEEITIKVLRKNLLGGNEDKEIEFIPKEWGGRGYLGCALKLQPI